MNVQNATGSARRYSYRFDDFDNAADPISPCGLGLGAFGSDLPRRLSSNHLVFHGGSLVMTSARMGKSLSIFVEPECEFIEEYFGFLHHLCYRSFKPVKHLTIEEINGEPATSSPYLEPIEATFNVFHDYKCVVVQREL